MPTRITMDVTEVQRKLGLLSAGMLRGIGLLLKGWLQETVQKSFETESTPEGVKWPPLSPKYEARKGAASGRILARRVGPGGRPGPAISLNRKNILYLSGSLFRGFASMQAGGVFIEEGPESVRVTAQSALPYSAIHQYGGRAGRGLAAFIPQRSYLPTPEFAERGAAPVVDEALQDAVGEAGLA